MPRFYYYKRKRRIQPYRRKRWFPYQRRRWIRYRYRRPTKAFRRRRQKWVRKLFKTRKFKRKTLPIKQWQPENIRTCKIKGNYTMFSCTKETYYNNYTQYRDSWTPEFFPSGGGWGVLVFNLGALFQEFLRTRNWWTVSNVDLPLCRYINCKLTFYRTENVDYIVYYTRNYPMTDNEYVHADACPNRMLMRRHKIIVKSMRHNPKKPYVRKKILPPKLLINKWFFQRQMVNTNLLMLTVTSCDLNYYQRAPKQANNMVYLTTLNPKIFTNLNYHRLNTNLPWAPKQSYNLYATDKHIDITSTNWYNSITYQDLIYLGQAVRLYEGEKMPSGSLTSYFENSDKWGNVFCSRYLQKEWTILVTNVQYTAFQNKTGTQKIDQTQWTVMNEPILELVAYNPIIDTGKDTSVYFVPNFSSNSNWNPPENPQLSFHGFPLWMTLWGWPDWQKKLALINQIDTKYILIVKSPYFQPNLKEFMFLDHEFIQNMPVYYDTHPQAGEQKVPLADELSWHPMFKYQQKSVNLICMSGPGTYKFPNNEHIEAHLHYLFRFKWGGSSSTMETIADPEKQPQFADPNNLSTGLQVQDPGTDPSTMLYNFDFRRHVLTQKATERITKREYTDETVSFPTDHWINPQPQQKTERDFWETLIQAQASEEKKENTQQLLRQLRERQQHLNNKLQRLIMESLKL
nr:MAG: ORF1 [TTV-like mini virus]